MHTRLTKGFSNYSAEDQVLYGVLLNDADAFSYLWYHDPILTTENTDYTIFGLCTQYEDNVYHIAAAGERDHFAPTNRERICEYLGIL